MCQSWQDHMRIGHFQIWRKNSSPSGLAAGYGLFLMIFVDTSHRCCSLPVGVAADLSDKKSDKQKIC